MKVQPEPTDFFPCADCKKPMLRVCLWDEVHGRVDTYFLAADFDYDWKHRDYKGRLVVHELEAIQGKRHSCPKGPDPSEDPKSYQWHK